LVGKDRASELYLKIKEKVSNRVGIDFEKREFSQNCLPRKIIEFISFANKDPRIVGIIVQLPFPKKLLPRSLEILGAIDPAKDVDCLTPINFGLLAMGKSRFLPATVRGIMAIIKNFKFQSALRVSNRRMAEWTNSKIVIVGGSNIVGKPLALHLSNLGATVTLCHSRTKDLASFTRTADILISATGVPGLIREEMVKKGVAVIDVGSPRGDVDFEKVVKKASFITPVPGGVGPLTVVSLLENVFKAAKKITNS
jgi:methylenetetrahydrofolate dehydrogenase (NADP+)/methenyltetrahydrofolate cyclohydrolase